MVSGVTFKRDSMDQIGGSLRHKAKRFEMDARPPLMAVPEEPTTAAADTTKPAFSSSLFFSSGNQHQKEKVPLHHPKSPPKLLLSRLSASTHSSFRNTTTPVAATIPNTTINSKTPPVYVAVPPSPAGTEYDGDDVVMADTINNNNNNNNNNRRNSGAQQEGLISQVGNLKGSTGLKRQYRSTPGASRFKPSSAKGEEEEFKVEKVTANYPPKPVVSTSNKTTSYISKPVAPAVVAASHNQQQPQERKRASLQLNTPTELFARVQALIAAAKKNGVPTTSKSTIQKRLESAAPSAAPAPAPELAVELGAQQEVTPTTSNTNPLASFVTMGNAVGTGNEGAAAAAAAGTNPSVTLRPSHSSSSTSKVSSNPLFASTPTHPTPPSISQPLRPLVAATAADTSALPSSRGAQSSIRRYPPTPYSAAVAAGMQARRVSLAGRTPGATGGRRGGQGGGNAVSVSEGFKLAEQLAAVADRLASVSPRCPPTNPIEVVETGDDLVGRHESSIEVTTKKTLSWTPPPPQQQQQQKAAAAAADTQYAPVRTLPQQQQQKDPVTPMFQDDVAKLLKALDAPTLATALRTSRSSRLGNPQNQYDAASSSPMNGGGDGADAHRLCFSSILDLDGFDSNGEKRADIALAGTPMIHPRPIMANNTNGNRAPGGTTTGTGTGTGRSMAPNGFQVDKELRQAESRALKAEAGRNEAAALLKDYQGTIASLKDGHASALARAEAALTRAQADAFNTKAEVEDLKNKLQTTEVSFHTLYHDKYVPLKHAYQQLHSDNGLVRGQNEELRGLVEAEQSKVHELAKELEKVRFESSQRVATAETRAEESRDALMKLQAELDDNERRMREDAKRAVAVAHAAKERASNELLRREEELCSLSVKLKEVERMLGQYKAENEGFYETKQILKRELESKEEENARLSLMCEELLQVAEEQGWALQ